MEPPVGLASGPLGAAQAADREIARQTALRARAVAAFAATRPAAVDRQPGQPGCMSADRRAARPEVLADVSEWAGQELVVALSITATAAEALLVRSLTLVHRLPQTLAALEAGGLHPGQLWPLLERVAPIADPRVRREVEAGLLDWAAGRVTTPAQLGAKARRMVLARDARGAAQRLTAALRRRGVSVHGDDVDGMAVLNVLATVPEAQALHDALGRYADALDDDAGDGPPRTRGQKMVDCLLDLVLRPGESDLPPVAAQWTIVAGLPTMAGGDEPGEIGGQPVPAEMIRSLARAMGLLPDTHTTPAPDTADQPANTADPAAAPDADISEIDASADPDAEQRELERWWDGVEDRALTEEWGGAEAAPEEELARYWAQTMPWADPDPGEDPPTVAADPMEGVSAPDAGVPATTVDESPPPVGWWAAADRAVDTAAQALAQVEVALGRARGAVERAEIADAADETTFQHSPGGRLSGAEDTLTALTHTTAAGRAELADLLDATAGGGLLDRPRLALTDALTGSLLVLTDSAQLRHHASCTAPACRRNPAQCTHDLHGLPGLRPPPPTAGYRPGAPLDRHLRARDRRCRFPGCRARVPHGGELDHNQPWPDGPTSAANLTGYCTPHHRGKHQAPGWQYDLHPDGTLTVTTPTGLIATTTPPPF